MRRREFITLLGGAAAASPLAARAQQHAMPVIGFMHSQTPDLTRDVLAGFHQGLKEAGYIEGQNVAVEYRWGNNQPERLPALAADLVDRQVAVIVATGGGAPAVAAKAATSTVPIVIAIGVDPVKLGLVASLNRPGGNVTGVTFITTELGSKRLDLLREMAPQATTIAYLVDPREPTVEEQGQTSNILAAARALGREVVIAEARSNDDFEAAFATLVQRRVGALIVAPYPIFTSNRDKLLALVARHKIPAIYQLREFALDGGLMSYGASRVDAFRKGGVYVGQILKGAKPADMPIQLPTKYELVINLKTARMLGLDVPPTLLARADEVIE